MPVPEDLTAQCRALRRLASRLVGDPELADDVVQDAWVRALERPPNEPAARHAWMGKVVRGLSIDRLRRRARRRARETPLDVSTTASDDASAVRGLELQAALLAAVRSLPEPYRHTIWQRYFEGLPPRDIAAAAGIPVKTVNTRLHRATGILRRQLDTEHDGDRRAWVIPLSAFTAIGPEGAVGAVANSLSAATTPPHGEALWPACSAAWSLSMKSLPIRLVVIAAFLLVAGGVAVSWNLLTNGQQSQPTPTQGPAGGLVTDAGDAVKNTGVADINSGIDTGTVARENVLAQSTDGREAKGSLVVTALWHDREPAAGVAISLAHRTPGLSQTAFLRAVTDAMGQVHFQDLTPSTYQIRSDRDADAELTVEAATATRHEMVLARGVDVAGTVVRFDGSPAAGARVWLQAAWTDWSYGRVAAHADENGQFELRSVPPGDSIGALAPLGGVDAPSELVDLDVVETVGDVAEVRLELRRLGGRVAGTVVTQQGGEPIAGARIAIGKRPRVQHLGARFIEQWSPRAVLSDENGQFTFDGVAPGSTSYAVSAPGHGLVRGELAVEEAASAEVVIAMPLATTLFGQVVDDQGRGVPDVAVHAFDQKPGMSFIQGGQVDYDETLGHVSIRTEDDGTYKMTDVPAGQVHLLVAELRTGGRDRGTGYLYHHELLELPAGSEVEWNPTLSEERVLEGRALYRDGHPLVGQFVSVRTLAGTEGGTLVTDREGSFRFVCLAEPIYNVYVQVFDKPRDAPPVELNGVVPGQGPIEIRATFDKPVKQAPGRVVGRVVDTGKRLTNPKAASILLINASHSWRTKQMDTDGRFVFGDVEPGRKRLVVMEGETAVYHGDWFELAPAARHDLGVVTTSSETSSVRVRLRRGKGTLAIEPAFYLSRTDGRRGATVHPATANSLEAGNLTPGDYKWSLHCRGMVSQRGTITLAANDVAELAIDLIAGAPVRFDVRYDPDADLGEVTVVYECDGEEVGRSDYQPGSALDFRRYFVGKTLPPGAYRAVITTTTGMRAETEFTVTSIDEKLTPVFELK